mgnify:CR=1 FL=1
MAKTWYFVRVKPRAEKRMQAWLKGSRIWNYLPVYVNVLKVQRRTERFENPIFPGYLIARMDAAERVQALKSNLVVMLIPIDKPREVIHQLRQVVRAMRGNQELKNVPMAGKTGRFVKIKSGPMTGLEGYVVKRGGKFAVVVNMEALGTAIEVAVSPEDID